MKILLIQLRRVGDILLTTPVISYLKKAIPGAEVHFLAEPMGRAVLETHPDLDRLLVHEKTNRRRTFRTLRTERYDAVIDFLGNPATAYQSWISRARWRVAYRHRFRRVFYNMPVPVPTEPEYVPRRKLRLVESWLKAAGLPAPAPDSVRPVLHLSEADLAFSSEWQTEAGVRTGGYAVLAPAHRHPIRAWRPEGYREVGLALRRRGLRVFLAWGPGEEAVVDAVRAGVAADLELLPPTGLRQMAAVFKDARVLVTNDSGAMHLAVAVGTPTVTMYGPTRPVDWNPALADGGPDRALTAPGVPCLGCHLTVCPVGHLCMTQLSASRVIEAAESILKE